MIHPDMCTMLAYVTTDAAISGEVLQEMLSRIVDETFNMISVDGDTSTNDTILVLANSEAGNEPITGIGEDYDLFYEALFDVCRELAKGMAKDGEGATKLVESIVEGADSVENARTLAKSVVCSSLTKAAMYGCDANWGRILCALGYSGVSFDPGKVELLFRDPEDGRQMRIYENGSGCDYSEKEATALLSKEHVQIISRMNMGDKNATAYGCDLTHEYVNINADYRS
jgi:glutamate N-acetyltransferase/amino-acid N-acetyltransferase